MLSKHAIELIIFFLSLTFVGLYCMPEHPQILIQDQDEQMSVTSLYLQAETANICCCEGLSRRSLSPYPPLLSVGPSTLGWLFSKSSEAFSGKIWDFIPSVS